jgi:hypothetical protein
MVMIQATLPADQGAMVVKALQQVVGTKAGEREAYWEERYASTFKSAGVDTATTGATASIADIHPDMAPSDSTTAVERSDMDVATVDVAAVDVAAVDIAAAGTSTHGDGSSGDHAPVVEPSDGDPTSNDRGATSVSEGTSAQDDDADDDDGIPLEGLLFERSYPEQRHADAIVDIAEHYLASALDPRKRRTGNRYEVVLHIERNELAAMGKQGESARFYVEPDWGLDESAARQISCDADLTEFIQDCTGNILDFKSRSRIVPARLKHALEIRDGSSCRFPGCGHSRYLEAHHVIHWIDGGETELENLVLICSAHHRLHHLGRFNIEMVDGAPTFISADGEVIPRTLDPQFPDVSEGTSFESVTPKAPPARASRSSFCGTHTPDEIAGLIRHRQAWGEQRRDRIWKRLLEPQE